MTGRVVAFVGPFPEPAATEFLARLEAHPAVELVAGFAQDTVAGGDGRAPGEKGRSGPAGAGSGVVRAESGLSRAVALFRDVRRRRGWLAVPVMAGHLAERVAWHARRPAESLRLRGAARRALDKVERLPDVHAEPVLSRVRALEPDLGVIYGGPILRPELFEIPRLGTLGIHHGRLPAYRGKKTTFWEMYHGEERAGVTIQRLNAGLDTGDVIRQGLVPTGRKRYGRVWYEVQATGVTLFVEAVLATLRGEAVAHPQSGEKGPLYRDPGAKDLLELWRRRARRWLP